MVALVLSALIGNMLFLAWLELLPSGCCCFASVTVWSAFVAGCYCTAAACSTAAVAQPSGAFVPSLLVVFFFQKVCFMVLILLLLIKFIFCFPLYVFFLVYIFTFVFARWRKTLHPERTSVGRWLLDEDKRLMVTVKLIGPGRWSLIAPFIPGRTQTQIFER
jgi:hypothetical protein